jgi:uncharacterized repeat protein (TIGR01451 family)
MDDFADMVTVLPEPAPVLSIAKDGPGTAHPGESITYTLSVTNDGSLPATNLVITDTLPVGANYVSGGTLIGEVVNWTLPSLDPLGASAQFQFIVTATQTITNFDYAVIADGGYGAVGTQPVTTEIIPWPAPTLSITKSGPSSAYPGETITYTLSVTNSGEATAINLVVTDTLPVGANYVSGGTLIGDVVNWTLPSLDPFGTSAQFQFIVTATQTITNFDYAVIADGGYGAVGTQPVTTEIIPWPAPTLSITKSGPSSASPGETITYTLSVTNSGDAPATNLGVTDTLPVGANYVSGGTLIGDVVNWTLPSLNPFGGSAQFQFIVTATQTITNMDYAVSADGGYGAVGTQPVTTEINPILEPDLSIVKSGPGTAEPGALITYTLIVINDGGLAATNLLVTDTLPVGANYISGGTLVGDVVSWTLPSLEPFGSTAAFQFVVTATQTITNGDYMVIADGGYEGVGVVPVTTVVEVLPPTPPSYDMYLPVVFR